MPFEKNNQLGFTNKHHRPLDKRPITFKGFEGQLGELKKIPGWQESLREYVEKLIESRLD